MQRFEGVDFNFKLQVECWSPLVDDRQNFVFSKFSRESWKDDIDRSGGGVLYNHQITKGIVETELC